MTQTCQLAAGRVYGLLALVVLLTPAVADAIPTLLDPSAATLELVAPRQLTLDKIDGLAFDADGNLFGVLEITGVPGRVVYIDKLTGDVIPLVLGISRADQIALHPDGAMYVTSEVSPGATTDRIYRVDVGYDADGVPDTVLTTKTSVTTSLPVFNPEGIVVLDTNGAFGDSGDLYIAQDSSTLGILLHVDPDTGATTALASGLNRPEGLAFGDFGGAVTAALYTAETGDDNVLRVEADGTVSVVGDPTEVDLESPDNLEFGPDGFLYVSEDRAAPMSRILRIAPDGSHEVFATGFGQAAGLAFDLSNGDLYISEQDLDRVWRVHFVPEPGTAGLLLAGLSLMGRRGRRPVTRSSRSRIPARRFRSGRE